MSEIFLSEAKNNILSINTIMYWANFQNASLLNFTLFAWLPKLNNFIFCERNILYFTHLCWNFVRYMLLTYQIIFMLFESYICLSTEGVVIITHDLRLKLTPTLSLEWQKISLILSICYCQDIRYSINKIVMLHVICLYTCKYQWDELGRGVLNFL